MPLQVTDAAGVAQQVQAVYLTDASGVAQKIAKIYATDAAGTPTLVYSAPASAAPDILWISRGTIGLSGQYYGYLFGVAGTLDNPDIPGFGGAEDIFFGMGSFPNNATLTFRNSIPISDVLPSTRSLYMYIPDGTAGQMFFQFSGVDGITQGQHQFAPANSTNAAYRASTIAAYNANTGRTFWIAIAEPGLTAEQVFLDAFPPTLNTATVNGDTLVLTYSKALDEDSVPAATAFTLAGTTATVSTVAVSGMTVTLTLSAPVSSTDTVTVTYTPPSENPIQGAAANPAAALAARDVTNNTSAVLWRSRGTAGLSASGSWLSYGYIRAWVPHIGTLDNPDIPGLGDEDDFPLIYASSNRRWFGLRVDVGDPRQDVYNGRSFYIWVNNAQPGGYFQELSFSRATFRGNLAEWNYNNALYAAFQASYASRGITDAEFWAAIGDPGLTKAEAFPSLSPSA